MERQYVFDDKVLKNLGLELDNGVARTFNRTGYMRNYLGEYSRRFCDREFTPEDRILEIGPGIGNVLGVLIDNGAKNIVAADSDSNHLDIINRLLAKTLPEKPGVLLETVHSALPEMKELGERTFDRILCALVLHYLKPDDFDAALGRLYQLLAPGGEITVTVGSPFIEVYKGFAEEYEERVKQNERHPGFMDDPRRYHPTGLNHNPGFFLVFDPDVLAGHFSEAGFKVLQSSYDDFDLTKRDTAGLIATKD